MPKRILFEEPETVVFFHPYNGWYGATEDGRVVSYQNPSRPIVMRPDATRSPQPWVKFADGAWFFVKDFVWECINDKEIPYNRVVSNLNNNLEDNRISNLVLLKK